MSVKVNYVSENTPKRSEKEHYSHKSDSSIFESGDSNSKDFTCDSSFRKHPGMKTESPNRDYVGIQIAPGYVSKPAAGLSQKEHYSHATDSSIFESGDSNAKDFTCDSSFKKHSMQKTKNNEDCATANEEDVGSQTAPAYVPIPVAGLETDYDEPPRRSQKGHYSHTSDSSVFEKGDSNAKDFTCDSSFRKQ